ncbi:MAG: thioesterase family protein [Lachnospiraceae bacterium]|nr:thioesterase family protein [Lachnospiraceae bacterium]MDD3661361.1 thioesterase family protein [Lachnospiraceae bacterium]
MQKYIHKVQYYETDQMAIVHHSNYIRWFEEARVDFLERIGYGYHDTEKMGIISPVTGVSCEYRSMTRFGESVRIGIKVKEFNGIRLKIGYEIEDADTGELRAVGESSHCFLSESGRPVSVKKVCPEYYEAINRYYKKETKTV